ncbi:MAG TPA: methyltransferase domain-containing protein [Solirubrobacteraceae bacterium]
MSGPAAAETFSAHAAEYDALRRRLVPDYDRFYGAVPEALERVAAGDVRRVLDLGAGTGLLSAVVADAFAEARIELLDASEPMLALAQERLGDAVSAVHIADMAGALPEGPFDAVVSALAIHHLEHADKRALMGRVHAALRPGGVFANAEQVDAPTAELSALYTQRWAEDCRALGATDEEIDGARDRMRHDRCADVETQLGWLRDAGFATADCTYKSWRFAVLIAQKES